METSADIRDKLGGQGMWICKFAFRLEAHKVPQASELLEWIHLIESK